MLIQLGTKVFGAGETLLGSVTGLVVNAGTKRATGILLDPAGLDRADHIIAISAVNRLEPDGLHLDEPAKTAAAEAPILDSEEVALPTRVAPDITYIPAAGVGGPVVADTPTVPGEYPNDDSFFVLAPLDPPPVEIFSNLGENEVRLERRTEVYSSDNHAVGKAIAFELGDLGLIESVTIEEGFLRKHDATVALANIGEFGTNAVHLRQSKDDLTHAQ